MNWRILLRWTNPRYKAESQKALNHAEQSRLDSSIEFRKEATNHSSNKHTMTLALDS